MVVARLVCVILLILVGPLAGCLSDETTPVPDTPVDGRMEVPMNGTANDTTVPSPWFEPDAVNGTHPQTGDPLNDTTYTMARNLNEWDDLALNVLILGPDVTLADGTSLHGALEAAVALWQDAIDTHGAPRLRHNVTFDLHYAPEVPPDDDTDLDIIISWFHYGGGFALNMDTVGGAEACLVSTQTDYAFVTDMTWRTAFHAGAHEFGHCLGMEHPEDHCPSQDLMAYAGLCPGQDADADDPYAVRCVSTLDLLVIDEAFTPAFDDFGQEPGEEQIEIPASEYWIHDCEEQVLGTA